MKILYILTLLLIACFTQAQISTNGTADGSITITPKGLQGKSNSTAGGGNLAVGSNALKNTVYNSAVSIRDGSSNTAVGDSSLFSNISGFQNTAVGTFTLRKNVNGVTNTAVGFASLYTNGNGTHNTGIGNLTLFNNTSGIRNTAIGNSALYYNKTGSFSTAVGNWALFSNLAEGNTAVGTFALLDDSLGVYNTAIGVNSGRKIKNGSYNTFVGFEANANSDDLINATAIGQGAIVNASDKVRIGNANVTVIEGQVAWSNPSDRRLKENIMYTNRLGLDFVTNLQTVSYNYIADKNKTRYDGFIAQDIEKLMTDLGVPFSGLKKSDDGMLSLAYSDFVMPLVNAIQEQQKQIEALQKQVEENADIKRRLEQLEAKF